MILDLASRRNIRIRIFTMNLKERKIVTVTAGENQRDVRFLLSTLYRKLWAIIIPFIRQYEFQHEKALYFFFYQDSIK